MEKKQCAKCKHLLLLECFRISKRTAQLTRRCSKCLDNKKLYKENRKCERGKLKEICCECKGSQICHHNKRRSTCRACGGKQICPHNLQRSVCRACGGGFICQHQKVRSKCRSCHGKSFCEHEKARYFCRTCDGSYVCKHLKQKNRCTTCNLLGHIAGVVRHRVYAALKSDKEMSLTEYLGCSIETFKKYIEQQFTEGMS